MDYQSIWYYVDIVSIIEKDLYITYGHQIQDFRVENK